MAAAARTLNTRARDGTGGREGREMIRLRRNTLRRTSDRVESLLVFVLVFGFLAGAPLLAWSAGTASYRSDLRAQQWEQEHVSQVDAVLLENAGTGGDQDEPATAPQAARARWTAPDGSARNGIVQAVAGSRIGSRVAVWVDDAGMLRAPPVRHHPAAQALLVGALVVFGLAAALSGLHRIARGFLDRRRDRAWGQEWLEVGPLWSRDRR
jgi:hypothetical protein